jgi:hypothetical protein
MQKINFQLWYKFSIDQAVSIVSGAASDVAAASAGFGADLGNFLGP